MITVIHMSIPEVLQLYHGNRQFKTLLSKKQTAASFLLPELNLDRLHLIVYLRDMQLELASIF
jgi:hypothetical protein